MFPMHSYLQSVSVLDVYKYHSRHIHQVVPLCWGLIIACLSQIEIFNGVVLFKMYAQGFFFFQHFDFTVPCKWSS